MPTPAERRALLFVAVVAALGTGVRGLRGLRPDGAAATDREALAEQIARVDSAITSGGRRASPVRGRPASAPTAPVAPAPTAPAAPAPTGPVDLDVADSSALDALPGIGPALASRIIADRNAHGPFGSLESLQRVKGVGPALAAKLGPHVTFSRAGRPYSMGSRSP